MVLYHGSNCKIERPDLSQSREDIDFAAGFYLTENYELAAKWACRKNRSFINQYKLEIEAFRVHRFSLNEEWLDFVINNRSLVFTDKYNNYDILIGPIADDKLFGIIDLYESGFISAENAMKIMNCMHYGNQVVIKKQSAADQIKLIGCKELGVREKQDYKEKYQADKKEQIRRTEELLRRINNGETI